MAELTINNIATSDPVTITPNILEASDTFTLPSSNRVYLKLTNNTGGELTVELLGTGMPKTVQVGGYGSASFANLSVTIADSETQVISLGTRSQILQGVVTVTGGAGISAILFTA